MKNKLLVRKSEINFNMIKELGYVLLLIVFFVGIIFGSIYFNGVSTSNFETYQSDLAASLENFSINAYNSNMLLDGMKIIAIFWIVGMSIVGMPILVLILGYKGFSIGYTISTILRILHVTEGNKFIFQNLFIKDVIIVFIMIFMANYSFKIFKNFFENKENLKVDAIKYTIISVLLALIYILTYVVLKIF